MESIDALAKAVNEFNGGLVLVSHDMRLISQVAEEIWICDERTVKKYHGDIQNFKMDMRQQMGIQGDQKGQLRGDASVKKDAGIKKKSLSKEPNVKDKEVVLEKKKVVAEKKKIAPVQNKSQTARRPMPTIPSKDDTWGSDGEDSSPSANRPKSSLESLASMKSSLPTSNSTSSSAPSGKYIPPHLRNKQ